MKQRLSNKLLKLKNQKKMTLNQIQSAQSNSITAVQNSKEIFAITSDISDISENKRVKVGEN